MNFFDSIKVTPPVYAKDIDATITKVQEKKDHFIKLSDDENSEEKKTDEETKPETEKTEGDKNEETKPEADEVCLFK